MAYKKIESINFLVDDMSSTNSLFYKNDKRIGDKSVEDMCFRKGVVFGILQGQLDKDGKEILGQLLNEALQVGAWLHWNKLVDFNKKTEGAPKRSYV